MRGLKIFIKVNYRSYIINLTAVVLRFIEAAYKKLFLKILQNSQENTCARFSCSVKLQGLRPKALLKSRIWHTCFPVNFYRTPPVAISKIHTRKSARLYIGQYLPHLTTGVH